MDPLSDLQYASDGSWHPAEVIYLIKHPIVDGRDVNTTVTGLNYNGVDSGDLVAMSGYHNFTTPGQIIEGKLFNDQIDVNADRVVFRNCMNVGGGDNKIGFNVFGSHCVFEGVDVHAAVDTSWYIGIQIADDAVGTQLIGVDVSGGENNLTNYGTEGYGKYSYIHDASVDGKVDAHADNIEVYGGSIEFDRCNLPMGTLQEDASINIAPFGGRTVTGMDVHDSVIDGGQAHIIAGADMPVTNVKIRRNFCGGHTNPDPDTSFGIYMLASYWTDHGLCDTQAEQDASGGVLILCPETGPDANHWYGCSDLTPDNTGEIAYPRT